MGTSFVSHLFLLYNIMRVLLLLLLNFLYLCSLAQNSEFNNNAVVEYKIFNNTDSPNTMYATLYINGSTTIYIEKYSEQVYNNAKEEVNRTNRITTDVEYLKIDHKRKEIYSFEYFGQNMAIVKDDYSNLKWDITQDTKVIAGYQCVKATTSYRGKDWVVWFTSEIPLAFGPWKLHGLPGLIIEVYDSANTFTLKAEKIEYRKDAIFDKEFSTLVKTKNKKILSKKQFIQDQDERDANLEAEWRQNNPDIVVRTIMKTRGGYELKYEWEQ